MTPSRLVAPAGDQEIRHGYTLTDLHQLTKLAVNTAKGWYAMDYRDLMEAAWFGIVEHLHTAEHWPPHHDLVRAGQQAVKKAVTDELHHAGYYRYKNGGDRGPGSMPAFVKFWFNPPTTIEPRIVERVTLSQIWPALTSRQREAFTALATHGDYVLAAEALDIEPQTFRSLIGRARREFLARWHDGEEPSRLWRPDRRVSRRETTDPDELAARAVYAAHAREKRAAQTATTLRSPGRQRRRLKSGSDAGSSPAGGTP